MNLRLFAAFALGCLIGCEGSNSEPATSSSTKVNPVLVCEMKWVGKGEAIIDGKLRTWEIPDAAEVKVINVSDADMDIGSRFGPEDYLDLRVEDTSGKDVKTEPLNKKLSPQRLTGHKPYILKAGQAVEFGVSLLETVPEENRVPGIYKVTAVYAIGGKEYISNELQIAWPWVAK